MPCHPTSHVSYTHIYPTQVPEDFGPVRTIAEGRGDTLYVGTTRNSILLGSVHTGFSLLVQVSDSPVLFPPSYILPANTGITVAPCLHFFPFLFTSLPRPFLLGLGNPISLPF